MGADRGRERSGQRARAERIESESDSNRDSEMRERVTVYFGVCLMGV